MHQHVHGCNKGGDCEYWDDDNLLQEFGAPARIMVRPANPPSRTSYDGDDQDFDDEDCSSRSWEGFYERGSFVSRNRPRCDFTTTVQPELTMVCRQVRQETLPIFYGNHTFVACWRPVEGDSCGLELWVERIGTTNAGYVRDIRIVCFNKSAFQCINLPRGIIERLGLLGVKLGEPRIKVYCQPIYPAPSPSDWQLLDFCSREKGREGGNISRRCYGGAKICRQRCGRKEAAVDRDEDTACPRHQAMIESATRKTSGCVERGQKEGVRCAESRRTTRTLGPSWLVDKHTPRHCHPRRPDPVERKRTTLYPKLQDVDSVKAYPEVTGMRHRFFWNDYDRPEDSQVDQMHSTSHTNTHEADSQVDQMHSTSHTNTHEVDMVAALVNRLVGQSVYRSEETAVPIPYLSQLTKLRSKFGYASTTLNELDIVDLEVDGEDDEMTVTNSMKETQEPASETAKGTLLRPLRLATIDNFQGEEARSQSQKSQRARFQGLAPRNRRHFPRRGSQGCHHLASAQQRASASRFRREGGHRSASEVPMTSIPQRLATTASRQAAPTYQAPTEAVGMAPSKDAIVAGSDKIIGKKDVPLRNAVDLVKSELKHFLKQAWPAAILRTSKRLPEQVSSAASVDDATKIASSALPPAAIATNRALPTDHYSLGSLLMLENRQAVRMRCRVLEGPIKNPCHATAAPAPASQPRSYFVAQYAKTSENTASRHNPEAITAFLQVADFFTNNLSIDERTI
ncbi:hypothetical protein M409DRAFT_48583 [Zasmidium cellare ATCC 36951]|uniref:DNA2/NAM7 helicase-like C-terminal domain-containing protein n=1 Tax=Zasmidium cellare ATCC 36951 TaxID=1080233 RepID=A0A6A6D7M0_ZASCE|nr:uncharacterized protein M409DRAFT_48583 [Zasmidium cellare ATCC 36951]KAF2173636.1 hypothetical protein M409DRAFT_48583 [Zasmidium cellare ATCC 36951]